MNRDLARRGLGLVDGRGTVDRGPGAMMRTTDGETGGHSSCLRQDLRAIAQQFSDTFFGCFFFVLQVVVIVNFFVWGVNLVRPTIIDLGLLQMLNSKMAASGRHLDFVTPWSTDGGFTTVLKQSNSLFFCSRSFSTSYYNEVPLKITATTSFE